MTIDFAPGKEFADLNLGAESRRLSTLDKVYIEGIGDVIG